MLALKDDIWRQQF